MDDEAFDSIKVRSEYKQEKPYRALDEALAEDQTEFDYEDIRGTIVGLYCPDYMGDLNSVGWHFLSSHAGPYIIVTPKKQKEGTEP